jgi:uracil phosphoribosyltransferase
MKRPSSINMSASMEEKKTEDDDEGILVASAPVPAAKVEPSFTAPYGPNVHVSKHPVLSHKLSILRSSSTDPSSFRSVLRQITFHLAYEATSTLTTRDVPITVPCREDHVDAIGHKVAERVALLPILRSGLGMVDSMLDLVADATVHHIGMYRTKSLMPVQYYNRLPKACDADVAYVLDPLIATSNTVGSVVGILKKWGVKEIHVVCVVASRKGLEELLRHHPEVRVTVGTVDDELNEEGDVMPGLGDAGDRLFGTPTIHDEEELVHPSKRKRTMSCDLGN